MDEDWETAAETEVVVRPKVNVNKWDGEDDDEDVKDSWDLEDEEEKKDEEKSETKVTTPAKAKPSKAMKAKIAEKERLAEEEEERRLAEMSPEEKLAEKLRLQKIQEESDLKSALDTFGVNTNLPINQFNPVTKEEFREFATTLSWCITQHKDSPFYDQLVEDVIRGICAHMSSADIKKVKICVESLHSEKLKMEKQSKKPAGKGKARATIRTENDDIETYKNYGDDFGGDEYDDFM